jgi:hypothetical protein
MTMIRADTRPTTIRDAKPLSVPVHEVSFVVLTMARSDGRQGGDAIRRVQLRPAAGRHAQVRGRVRQTTRYTGSSCSPSSRPGAWRDDAVMMIKLSEAFAVKKNEENDPNEGKRKALARAGRKLLSGLPRGREVQYPNTRAEEKKRARPYVIQHGPRKGQTTSSLSVATGHRNAPDSK